MYLRFFAILSVVMILQFQARDLSALHDTKQSSTSTLTQEEIEYNKLSGKYGVLPNENDIPVLVVEQTPQLSNKTKTKKTTTNTSTTNKNTRGIMDTVSSVTSLASTASSYVNSATSIYSSLTSIANLDINSLLSNIGFDVSSITDFPLTTSIFGSSSLNFYSNLNIDSMMPDFVGKCYYFGDISGKIAMPDICSLLDGVDDICSPLPNIPFASKKTYKVDRAYLKRMCSSIYSNDALKTTVNEAISDGKHYPAAEYSVKVIEEKTVTENINTEVLSDVGNQLDSLSQQYQTNDGVDKETKLIEGEILNNPKVAMLIKGAAVNGDSMIEGDELKKIVENIKTSKKESPYTSRNQYENDTNELAEELIQLESDLNFFPHIQSMRSTFSKINNDTIGDGQNATSFETAAQERTQAVEAYIEGDSNGKGGYRQIAYRWATKKAQHEIVYKLPFNLQKYDLDRYYVNPINLENHDEQNNFGKNAQIQRAEKRFDIKRQSLVEAEIKAKWFQVANNKVDELKERLYYEAIKAAPFDRKSALEESLRMIQAINPPTQ